MKRILFVSAGHGFPQGAFTFLQSLQDQEPVCATGLFFSPIENEVIATTSQLPLATLYLQIKEKARKIVEENKTLFARECESLHIKHQVHENEGEWHQDILVQESRFSDLVLLSGELFYSDVEAGQPNRFLQEALHVSECPVVIVPENYTALDRLIIAYDGSKESLFAIKQFCYLLPQFADLPTEIIYVKNEEQDSLPDIGPLKKFSRLHFSSMNFSKLHFKAAQYFATWIGEKQHTMMVSGSFGRSAFSYMNKRSFAEQVIRDHKMPVFIAHP